MREGVIGRVLWRAGEDEHFRRRMLANMGAALAEEGFILSDDEMGELRGLWEGVRNLGARAAQERILAQARSWRR